MIQTQTQVKRAYRVLDESIPGFDAIGCRTILFQIDSLDEVVQASSLFYWVLEHLSPLMINSAVLEGYELDEEKEGVLVTLSEPLKIPAKVRREFGIEVHQWTDEMARADAALKGWMAAPMDRREDVLAYIAEQLAKEQNGIAS